MLHRGPAHMHASVGFLLTCAALCCSLPATGFPGQQRAHFADYCLQDTCFKNVCYTTAHCLC